MSDRLSRARQIAEGNHGRVVAEDGDAVVVEVPADVAPGLAGIWGQGGFSAQFIGQTTRDAPRRVTNWQTGAVIVCEGDLVTTSFYRYRIGLRPAQEGVQQPRPADLTAPTPPWPGCA
ncbi:hypothetical protein ACQR1I_14250 [Bradyrhizobium sp. HKCCYLS2038]|uniref:hypothetical protein n=1 Tax=unclassified Bradyrhizobium TaxID=2631580 RepID=UPI003EB99CF0